MTMHRSFVVVAAAAWLVNPLPAESARAPYVQVAGDTYDLAHTCASRSAPAAVTVNLDVPAGLQYSYTVSYIDAAWLYVYGPNTVSLTPVRVPLYTGAMQTGPIANAGARFDIGTPAAWFHGPTEDDPVHPT